MSYNIYIGPDTWIHPKNKIGLDLFISNGFFKVVNDIDDAQIIIYMSSSHSSDRINNIDILNPKYKDKIILLGPHFTVFPTPYLCNLKTPYNNVFYNTLSDWVSNMFKKYIKNDLIIVKLPYPVDVNLFNPENNININMKNNVFIYLKYRKPKDITHIYNFLINMNFNVKIFNYEQKYNESEYISYLKTCSFGIWVGINESQGFALEEALSLNIPLIVYNVKNMGCENGYENNELYCNTISTTIPYWDERCGEVFYNEEDFEKTFINFNLKLEEYRPREYILENLEVNSLFNKKWKPFIENFFNNVK
jgi:hypothetical protein